MEFDAQKMLDRFLSEAPFMRELPFTRISFLTPFCDVYEKDGKYFVELSLRAALERKERGGKPPLSYVMVRLQLLHYFYD
jgi:hypothetical protein